MKITLYNAVLASLVILAGATPAKTIVVDTTDNVTPAPGHTNLVQAVNLLKDGDTIQFNIPGAGVHYIDTPVDGYPLITANNITIDGYSQSGAVPNSNPIHAPNNAQLKIVLTSTNGNGLSMQTAITNYSGIPNDNLGFGPDELAILGFFRGSNITVKGLAFQSAPQVTGSGFNGDMKTIAICPDSAGQCPNWHVSGCWFGLDPGTGQVAYMPDKTTVAMPAISIAAYRSRDPDGSNPTYAQPGTIGVAAGSTNAPAEFNVFITGYGFDSEGLNFRISGNFFNVLPDGMHNFDPSSANTGQQQGDGYVEVGRVSDNLLIGTDSDGVNDADEGNLFGGVASSGWANLYLWSSHGTNIVIAGNWYGVAIDGVTRFTNKSVVIHGVSSSASIQFGSDFDGVSDQLEGNLVFNNSPFAVLYPSPDPVTSPEPLFFDMGAGPRISMRGNSLVNNNLVPFRWADGSGGQVLVFTNYEAAYMDTSTEIIPALDSTNSTYPHLLGTFAPGLAPYTNVIIDVYQLDQDGWHNGKAFPLLELTDFSTYTNGFPQGSKYLGSFPVTNTGSFDIDISGLDLGLGWVTVTANYSADPPGTHRGRTHTSNFSNPITVNPGGAASVGLTHIVPDVACWYNHAGNFVTNGPIKLAEAQATMLNWEPYTGVLGDSMFLIGFNTYANDGTFNNQNFVVTKQPAAGGAAKIDYEFYADSGTPFMGVIDPSRPNGNPQRVAGDKRLGATNFITEAETSIGQISEFQTVNRWTNNPIYTGSYRYAAEQLFTLDTATLKQTPVTNAWDYIYGPYVAGALGPSPDSAQLSRTGGRSEFLDNGNIVVMVEDRTELLSSAPPGQATTFSIITPDGSVVKGPTLVDPHPIWDNMAAYQGGFAIRVGVGTDSILYFFDNAGNPTHTNYVNASSGLAFDTGRGDGTRIGSDIRSHYVYLAGRTSSSANGPVNVAIFDSRTGNLVAQTTVTDTDPLVALTDRTSIAVDALDRFCVAYVFQPNSDFRQQVAARVMAFDGTNITSLTHSFFPFVNFESNPTNVLGITTFGPNVSMTTRQICIAAKGSFNSTNNPAGGPDTAAETTLYTVINHPGAVPSAPLITVANVAGNLVVSWPADAGTFTLQSTAKIAPTSWSPVTPQPPTVQVGNNFQMTLPISAGNVYFRLAR